MSRCAGETEGVFFDPLSARQLQESKRTVGKMSSSKEKQLLNEAADIFLRYRQNPSDEDVIQARENFVNRGDAERKAWQEIADAWSATGAPSTRKSRLLPAILWAGLLLCGYLLIEPMRIQLAADFVSDRTPILVELASGDRVHLDANTALSDDTSEFVRRVNLLRGAGYFEVESASTPFIVVVGDAQIEVLGTSFEVSEVDGSIQVSVFEGRVAVERAGQKIEIASGDRVIWTDEAPVLDRVALGDVASWRGGRLVADGMTFGQVIDILDRRIPGRVLIMDRDLRSERVTGSFDLERPKVSLRNLAAGSGGRVVATPPVATLVFGRR